MTRSQSSNAVPAWHVCATRLGIMAALLASLPAHPQGLGTATVFAGSGRFLESETVAAGRASVEDVRTDFDGANTRWTYLASSYADMNRGAAGGGIIIDTSGTSNFFGVTVNAIGEVSDEVKFIGSRPGMVTISLAVSGSFASMAQAIFRSNASLALDAAVSNLSFDWAGQPLSADKRASVLATGEVVVLDDHVDGLSAILKVRQLVTPGQVLGVLAHLDLRLKSDNNDHSVMNFGHTAQLGIEMPDGWTFTSSSGVFMSQLPASVPEPAALLMWLAGFGLAGVLGGRRIRRV
jgi:hypothetical protein